MDTKLLIFIVLGLIVLGGLFWVFMPKAPMQPSQVSQTTKNFPLVVQNKKLISGPTTLQVVQGDSVVITITSDTPEELHLHGYDKSVDLEANVPAKLSFIATMSGRFPYELEHSKTEIGVLEVLP